MKEIFKLADLEPDIANPNAGTQRGQGIIETSLRRLGAGRSICVDKNGKTIAGNNVLQKAAELGFDIEVVHTNGTRLVVVVRDDLDLDSDPRARELSIADNRASELGLSWRLNLIEEMRLTTQELKLDYLFRADEMRKELSMAAQEATRNVERETAQTSSATEATTCPRCGEIIFSAFER